MLVLDFGNLAFENLKVFLGDIDLLVLLVDQQVVADYGVEDIFFLRFDIHVRILRLGLGGFIRGRGVRLDFHQNRQIHLRVGRRKGLRSRPRQKIIFASLIFTRFRVRVIAVLPLLVLLDLFHRLRQSSEPLLSILFVVGLQSVRGFPGFDDEGLVVLGLDALDGNDGLGGDQFFGDLLDFGWLLLVVNQEAAVHFQGEIPAVVDGGPAPLRYFDQVAFDAQAVHLSNRTRPGCSLFKAY